MSKPVEYTAEVLAVHMQSAISQSEQTGVIDRAFDSFQQHPSLTIGLAVISAATVGGILEYRHLRKVDHANAVYNEFIDGVVQDVPSRTKRFGKVLTSMAFVGGGLIGAANTYPVIDFTARSEVAPKVEIIADKSGATLNNDERAALLIQGVLNEFSQKDTIQTESIVAVDSTVRTLSTSDAAKVSPFGDAPMDTAMQLGLGRVIQFSTSIQEGNVPSSAVVVITNGNQLGLNRESTAALLDVSQSPIYVFDTNPGTSATAELQKLTRDTGGEYFGSSSFDTPQEQLGVIAQITDSLAEAQAKKEADVQTSNTNERLIIAGLSVATIASWFAGRKYLTNKLRIAKRK